MLGHFALKMWSYFVEIGLASGNRTETKGNSLGCARARRVAMEGIEGGQKALIRFLFAKGSGS
jgi:hypothetical protein